MLKRATEKIPSIKLKSWPLPKLIIFYRSSGCLKANFGSLLRGQTHLPEAQYFNVTTEKLTQNFQGSYKEVLLFYQSSGCPKANFRPLMQRQLHSPDMNHFYHFDPKVIGGAV